MSVRPRSLIAPIDFGDRKMLQPTCHATVLPRRTLVARAPFLTVLLLLIAAIGCSREQGGAGESEKPTVLATVGMVADIVRNVGGEHVDVVQLMGSGVDPHLYAVTRDDVQAIAAADLVFYSGLLLEGKMTDALERVGESKPVISVAGRLPEDELLAPEGSGGHPDPHVWMDIALWMRGIDVVAEALGEHLPEHREQFEANAAEYKSQLEKLDAYARESLGSIPEERRVLVTSHDAFNYFGRAYGLEVMGVQGLSTESAAGLQRINELVDVLVEQQVPAVFVESSVPRKSIEALVQGAESRGTSVRIGGELFSDAMGPSGTYEGTYIGMLDHNITLVTRALGGEAPEKGLNGKLSL